MFLRKYVSGLSLIGIEFSYEKSGSPLWNSEYLRMCICPYGLSLYGLLVPMDHSYKFSTMCISYEGTFVRKCYDEGTFEGR